jgi:hypothetical protein
MIAIDRPVKVFNFALASKGPSTHDVNDDAKGKFRRVEVLTGPGRRRRWSADEKARLAARHDAGRGREVVPSHAQFGAGFVGLDPVAMIERGTASESGAVAVAPISGEHLV